MNETVMEQKLTIFRTLFLICGSVGVYLVGYLLALSFLSWIPGVKEWHTMYLNAIAMATAAGAMLVTVKKKEIGIKIENRPIMQLGMVAVMAYSASVLFNVLLGSIPWEKVFEQQVTPDAMVYYSIPLWARMLCYEAVAPIAEELLFRQVIYKRLRNISPVWVATVVSALLFGLYHGNLVQGMYAFIMGCLLALVYEWSGSFAASVVFHMVANHVSDITYEFESVSKVLYSPCGGVVSAILLVITFVVLFKNKNKCSKKH